MSIHLLNMISPVMRGTHPHCLGHENLDPNLSQGLYLSSLSIQSGCIPGTSSDWPEMGRRSH